MIPRFILTNKHSCAIVKFSGGDLAAYLDRRGRFMVSGERPCVGSYIRLEPYVDIRPDSSPIKPLLFEGREYVPIYVVYRGIVSLNYITLSEGKVSLQVEDADETILRGLVVNNEDYVKYMIDSLINKYLEYPTPILTMVTKLTSNPDKVEEVAESFSGRDYYIGGAKIYHKPGFVMSVRRLSSHRVDVALVSSIEFIDDFRAVVKRLILCSTLIHDIRFGRLGELPMGMDVFYPITSLPRSPELKPSPQAGTPP